LLPELLRSGLLRGSQVLRTDLLRSPPVLRAAVPSPPAQRAEELLRPGLLCGPRGVRSGGLRTGTGTGALRSGSLRPGLLRPGCVPLTVAEAVTPLRISFRSSPSR